MNGKFIQWIIQGLSKKMQSFGATEVTAGKQAGLISSSLFFSSLLFSFVWGYIGDVKGHTFTIIVCQVGWTLTSLSFGFSFNLNWAIFSRILQGCFIGIASSTKCIVYESCDKTNLSLGMSLLSTAVSAGFLIGPSFTGLLVFPDKQYPGSFSKDNIFARFGTLLPMSILFVVDLMLLVLGLIVLPKHYRRKQISIPLPAINNNNIKQHHQQHLKTATSSSPNKDGDQEETEDLLIQTTTSSSSWIEKIKSSRIGILLRDKHCVIMFTLYGVMNLMDAGLNILFSLYAATHTDYNGLGFMPKDISYVLLAVVGIIIFLQLAAFPKLLNWYGPKKMFIVGTVGFSLFFPLMPTLKYITNRYALYAAASLHLLICRGFVSMVFLAGLLLLSNSVDIQYLGLINGIGIATASVGRISAPLIFGNLFSWSVSNIKEIKNGSGGIGFPFDEYFAFLVMSLVGMLCSLVTYFYVPLSYNQKSELLAVMAEELENEDIERST